jgi:hypothetical protein
VRIYLLVLLVFLCSPAASAQKPQLSLEIELGNSTIERGSRAITARLLIKNITDKDLQTAAFDSFEIAFAKCPGESPGLIECNKPKSRFRADVPVPNRTVRAGEVFELEFNLAELKWRYDHGILNSGDYDLKKLSEDLIYLAIKAKKHIGYQKVSVTNTDTEGMGTTSEKSVPDYRETISNVVNVVINR